MEDLLVVNIGFNSLDAMTIVHLPLDTFAMKGVGCVSTNTLNNLLTLRRFESAAPSHFTSVNDMSNYLP